MGMRNLAPIGQAVPEIWPFFDILYDGGRPPSWICCRLVWATREAYLAVRQPLFSKPVVSIRLCCSYVELSRSNKTAQDGRSLSWELTR